MAKRLAKEARIIGKRLAAARHAKGFTLRDVENGTGVSNPMVSLYETGSSIPSIIAAAALCKFLGLRMDDLIAGCVK